MSLNHSALTVFVPYYMLRESSESAHNGLGEAQNLFEQEILLLLPSTSYMQSVLLSPSTNHGLFQVNNNEC